MNQEKTIAALNKLVEINNDRVEGYDTASKETEDTDLKEMFYNLIATSETNLEELKEEITRLGGTPTAHTMLSGKFFRAWMDVKAALTAGNKKFIMESCEFGEDMALATYTKVLKNETEHLTSEQLDMVQEQYDVLKADHDDVKSLRDELKAKV